jgi:hypothetical protein
MAELKSDKRKKLSNKEFAGPGRTYPIPDKAHARNAKARASQAQHAGRMSKAQEHAIDAKADKKLKN